MLLTAMQVLLGNDAMHFGIEMPTFQRKILPPNSWYGYYNGKNINPQNLTIFMLKFGLSESKKGTV
jgi:hypothetical protein